MQIVRKLWIEMRNVLNYNLLGGWALFSVEIILL